MNIHRGIDLLTKKQTKIEPYYLQIIKLISNPLIHYNVSFMFYFKSILIDLTESVISDIIIGLHFRINVCSKKTGFIHHP